MADFFPFLAYVFVTTFTPGPNNILSMTYAMRYGYRRIFGFLLGITSGFLLVMLLCAVLNVVLVRLLPQVEGWLNVLGALYMLYLAWHVLLSKPVEDGVVRRAMNSFWGGFTLQFLNLKGILYGVTVFSIFIVPSYPHPLQAAAFAPVLAGIAFIAITTWAVGGNLFRSLLARNYRLFNLIMAGLLVYTAVASLLH